MLSCFSCVWFFATPWTVALQAPLSMDFPGKNTGLSCLFLLQGILPTLGSNPCLLRLLHCRQIFFFLNHWDTNEAQLTQVLKKRQALFSVLYVFLTHLITTTPEVGNIFISILQKRKLRHRKDKKTFPKPLPSGWQNQDYNTLVLELGA